MRYLVELTPKGSSKKEEYYCDNYSFNIPAMWVRLFRKELNGEKTAGTIFLANYRKIRITKIEVIEEVDL